MKKKIIIYSIVLFVILIGCGLFLRVTNMDKESESEVNEANDTIVDELDYIDHVVIDIQPLGNFSEAEAERIAGELEVLAFEQLKMLAEIYVQPTQPPAE